MDDDGGKRIGLGRLTAGDVWESTWPAEAIESVSMDLNLDSTGARETDRMSREAIKWTELMDK
jgi:hypothetical protein